MNQHYLDTPAFKIQSHNTQLRQQGVITKDEWVQNCQSVLNEWDTDLRTTESFETVQDFLEMVGRS